jgi:hypothetical protein
MLVDHSGIYSQRRIIGTGLHTQAVSEMGREFLTWRAILSDGLIDSLAVCRSVSHQP